MASSSASGSGAFGLFDKSVLRLILFSFLLLANVSFNPNKIHASFECPLNTIIEVVCI